ncbi:1,4-dihydroxy-6-naphthoate synthase [Catenulispora pinisilvae]|uniref:1,4-dihydroxy-6-naphthoate synthase n=1 Tax=Catenulispora pinisilvae TaxID=2705253 RepID=UPI001891C82E|nr:1,4-dihydroxy-6-naphthoate synthase [Catenulispora pinisilvae]
MAATDPGSGAAVGAPTNVLPEKLSIAYSPCPNDTFVFHALTHGLVPGAPAFDVTFADIDVTNYWVQEADAPDVLKISYPALPLIQDRYELLHCGGALGRGCGPLVLSQGAVSAEALAGGVIAVPSLLSTAFRLFELWAEQNVPNGMQIKVLPFHEIMPAVAAGEVTAGLVIHEARFTYQNFGLTCHTDLGQWWEAQTGLPIPLGAIVARKDLGEAALTELSGLIRASVDHAWADPKASHEYVMAHAQEMDPEVAQQHIGLYVNEFTRDLGPDGLAAVEALLAKR